MTLTSSLTRAMFQHYSSDSDIDDEIRNLNEAQSGLFISSSNDLNNESAGIFTAAEANIHQLTSTVVCHQYLQMLLSNVIVQILMQQILVVAMQLQESDKLLLVLILQLIQHQFSKVLLIPLLAGKFIQLLARHQCLQMLLINVIVPQLIQHQFSQVLLIIYPLLQAGSFSY